MKLSRNRKLHRFFRRTEGAFGRNVVLFGGMALPYVIMPAVSLKTAAALSVSMLASVLFGMLAAHLGDRLLEWARVMVITVSALTGVAVSRLLVRLISNEIFDTLGIYLPLMAVNSIVVIYAVQYVHREKVSTSLIRVLGAVLGFTLVVCSVGLIRELLSTGTIWGVPVAKISFPAANTVFFGFLLVAFMGAALQALRRAIMCINLRLDNPTAEELKRQQEERMVD